VLGMNAITAAKVLGLSFDRQQVIPDGVRTCYCTECLHGPGYNPPRDPRNRLNSRAASTGPAGC
jgi:hypothetical protein